MSMLRLIGAQRLLRCVVECLIFNCIIRLCRKYPQCETLVHNLKVLVVYLLLLRFHFAHWEPTEQLMHLFLSILASNDGIASCSISWLFCIKCRKFTKRNVTFCASLPFWETFPLDYVRNIYFYLCCPNEWCIRAALYIPGA